MGITPIEWTDFSINPIRARLRDAAHAALVKGGYDSGVGHYCEKISPGCAHCYSADTQARFGMPVFPGANKSRVTLPVLDARGAVAATERVELFFDETKLHEVLRRKQPTKCFWCDMTDLFGSWMPDAWIDKCFATMALTPQHTHQVLTKRPARMAEYLAGFDAEEGEDAAGSDGAHRLSAAAGQFLDGEWIWGEGKRYRKRIENFISDCMGEMDGFDEDEPEREFCPIRWPLPNVWLGTSIENQQAADERYEHLRRCPAAVRFYSAEPLLGPIERLPLDGIHWVIVGGESGPKARPMDVAWVRSIVRQCKDAGVACFVKQFGGDVRASGSALPGWPIERGMTSDMTYTPPKIFLKDKKGADPREWPEDLRVRQFPAGEVAHATA